jgi:hypothetical protein
MNGAKTPRGNASQLRLAGYFAWFIAAVLGINAFTITLQEYIAQHRWPVASGQVSLAEEKSRRNPSSSSRSTVYFIRFTVEFDPPLEQCGPGMLLTIVGGPTRCMGTFDTLEGSQEDAYAWKSRHWPGSPVRVHYQPYGQGLRFADESIGNIYPWKKIFVTFVIFLVGFGFVRLARRQAELTPDSPPGGNDNSLDEALVKEELIDLNLR